MDAGASSVTTSHLANRMNAYLWQRRRGHHYVELIGSASKQGFGRRVMNLKVATWLCIIVGGSAIASAQKTDLPSLVKKIKPSVVTIEVDGLCKAAGCQGTGFYVGSGRVATNYHVISGISEGAVRLVSGTTVPIKGILYANSDHDIAILQVGSTTEATPALSFAAADPEQGDGHRDRISPWA